MKNKEQVWYSNPELGFPALSETRQITFPKEALVAALKFLATTSGQALPHGSLEKCALRADPEVTVSIEIRDEVSRDLHVREFAGERLGAALIAYCRQVKVPLPRAAEKSLTVSGDNLLLRMQVKSRGKLAHHLEPQRFTGNSD
jgi:hypothetical protein